MIHTVRERIRKALTRPVRFYKTELSGLQSHLPPHEAELRARHEERAGERACDTFVLYRIIGNDLYPRHEKGQSRANVRFIIENEAEFAGCEKRWVLNRIVDRAEHEAIVALLERYGQDYIDIPFEAAAFTARDWDLGRLPYPGALSSIELQTLPERDFSRAYTAAYRLKNNYLMNNNGARNAALEDGEGRAAWVLPWDGNCFLTPAAWEDLRATVTAHPHLRYFVVPMQRVEDNTLLISGELAVSPEEEPQVIFRHDAPLRFDEAHPYGRRPKVELLKRLGVPGPWNHWRDDPWDLPSGSMAAEAGEFRAAGWVARLASGVPELERTELNSFIDRGRMRQTAICSTINRVTQQLEARSGGFGSLDPDAIPPGGPVADALLATLRSAADEALSRPAPSVVDKTEHPPSGEKRDYYHPAPYWWPNPKRRNGIPYIRKDGERVPGTHMYEAESERYDRTRVQRLFDDGLILALAWRMSGERHYAEHAAAALRRWFLDPESAVTPHLRYAQVRWGHDGNEGQCSGIIEWKDFYYYLDAVRLLEQAQVLSAAELEAFREWLRSYLSWLRESKQGLFECAAANNHGVYYDLQVASIAAFLDDDIELYRAFIRARDRLELQFNPEGVQMEELKRTQTAHYCCFNLQGWLHLAELATRWGDKLSSYESPGGVGLADAVDWLTAHWRYNWPYPQSEPFDQERFLPLLLQARQLGFSFPGSDLAVILARRLAARKPCFHPHDGIRPFWGIESAAWD